MAKSNSFLKFQGTFQGTTYVDSRTYGDHIRAARGTHKPAVVNEAFHQESTRLQKANVPAKILKDALDPYREHFKGGQLWQRLVSQFRKQLHSLGEIDFSQMEPVEVHEKYPLSRFLYVSPKLKYDSITQLLQITLDYGHHPNLKGMSYVDGYRVDLIGIFPDLINRSAATRIVYSPVMNLKSQYVPLTLEFAVPTDATAFVLCIKAEGFEKNKLCSSAVTKGMRIVAGGVLNQGD